MSTLGDALLSDVAHWRDARGGLFPEVLGQVVEVIVSNRVAEATLRHKLSASEFGLANFRFIRLDAFIERTTASHDTAVATRPRLYEALAAEHLGRSAGAARAAATSAARMSKRLDDLQRQFPERVAAWFDGNIEAADAADAQAFLKTLLRPRSHEHIQIEDDAIRVLFGLSSITTLDFQVSLAAHIDGVYVWQPSEVLLDDIESELEGLTTLASWSLPHRKLIRRLIDVTDGDIDMRLHRPMASGALGALQQMVHDGLDTLPAYDDAGEALRLHRFNSVAEELHATLDRIADILEAIPSSKLTDFTILSADPSRQHLGAIERACKLRGWVCHRLDSDWSARSEVCRLALALLQLAAEGLTPEGVMRTITLPILSRNHDTARWRHLLTELGAYWQPDAEIHRYADGEHGSFSQAAMRLSAAPFLAAADHHHEFHLHSGSHRFFTPAVTDEDGASTLADRLVMLEDWIAWQASEPMTLSAWRGAFGIWLERFLAEPGGSFQHSDQDDEDLRRVMQALEPLEAATTHALPFEIFRDWAQRRLSTMRTPTGQLFAHGIHLGRVEQNVLPFAHHTFVLGTSAANLPRSRRNDHELTDDLAASLESIMATERSLWLSYVGQTQRGDVIESSIVLRHLSELTGQPIALGPVSSFAFASPTSAELAAEVNAQSDAPLPISSLIALLEDAPAPSPGAVAEPFDIVPSARARLLERALELSLDDGTHSPNTILQELLDSYQARGIFPLGRIAAAEAITMAEQLGALIDWCHQAKIARATPAEMTLRGSQCERFASGRRMTWLVENEFIAFLVPAAGAFPSMTARRRALLHTTLRASALSDAEHPIQAIRLVIATTPITEYRYALRSNLADTDWVDEMHALLCMPRHTPLPGNVVYDAGEKFWNLGDDALVARYRNALAQNNDPRSHVSVDVDEIRKRYSQRFRPIFDALQAGALS